MPLTNESFPKSVVPIITVARPNTICPVPIVLEKGALLLTNNCARKRNKCVCNNKSQYFNAALILCKRCYKHAVISNRPQKQAAFGFKIQINYNF